MDLLERLRARKWPLTAQRRVVAETLTGSHVHMSADEVYQKAKEKLPEISRATVYNTLEKLAEIGEILKLTVKQGPALYDPNVEFAHHHLVCKRCQAVYDVKPSGVSNLTLGKNEIFGFNIEEVSIIFQGICKTCSDKNLN